MILNINDNWNFRKENGSFKTVSLPHDAMLEEKRDFNCHNGKQSGYFPGGKYTYAKTVEFTDADLSKIIKLFFEGVYQNCKIYINDSFAGSHKYGYTEFEIDISAFAKCGENTIRVEVVSTGVKFLFKLHRYGNTYSIGDTVKKGTYTFSFFTDIHSREKNAGEEAVKYKTIRIVTNGGKIVLETRFDERHVRLNLERGHWYRAELWGSVDTESQLLAITSPIYCE